MIYACFRVFGALEQVGKLGPNTPNHAPGFTEIHFTSTKALLECKSHLREKLGHVGETGLSQIMARKIQK